VHQKVAYLGLLCVLL